MPILLDCPLQIHFPEKVSSVITGAARYKVLHGGRGGTKSWDWADYLIAKGAFAKYRILCTREMQNSIRDSVYRLLLDRIYFYGLKNNFQISADSIKSRFGSEYIFKGLHHNITEIKSLEGVDICWVEEADKVSKESWEILIPTIRKEGSEILVSFNPDDENSATYQMFLGKNGPPPNTLICEINYDENPWFPDVLKVEMEYDKRVDPEKYEHVWLGKPKKYSEACIFKRVRMEDFEEPPEGTQFFYGADFGFSIDPTCLIRMFIKDNKLYITHEAYGHEVEITELPAFFKTVPGSYPKGNIPAWKIRGDSERPDTISYLRNEGFDIDAAEKGKGSVEDGIQFLCSFEEIIIHTRCPNSYSDFKNCRWKQDKTTLEILPIPLDKSNHAPDAARYGLEPYIKNKVSCWDVIPSGPLPFLNQ